MGYGNSAGSGDSTFCSATGPPVDAPIAKHLYCFPVALTDETVGCFAASLWPESNPDVLKNACLGALSGSFLVSVALKDGRLRPIPRRAWLI